MVCHIEENEDANKNALMIWEFLNPWAKTQQNGWRYDIRHEKQPGLEKIQRPPWNR